jgi:hypothetical protein
LLSERPCYLTGYVAVSRIGRYKGRRVNRVDVTDEEAFMEALEPHEHQAAQKIFRAAHKLTGRACDVAAAEATINLLRDAGVLAFTLLNTEIRLTGRQNLDGALRRARILRQRPQVARQIGKALANDNVTARLQSVIEPAVGDFLLAILTVWQTGQKSRGPRAPSD